MNMVRLVDIEIYYNVKAGGWPQARYLVHGHDDVLWTDDLDTAIEFLKESCKSEHDS